MGAGADGPSAAKRQAEVARNAGATGDALIGFVSKEAKAIGGFSVNLFKGVLSAVNDSLEMQAKSDKICRENSPQTLKWTCNPKAKF